MDGDKISRILTAKARIEDALSKNGVGIDAHVREAIGWKMRALVDSAGLAVNDAADQIIDNYLAPRRKSA